MVKYVFKPHNIGLIVLFLFGVGFSIFGIVTTAKVGPGPNTLADCTFTVYHEPDDRSDQIGLTACYDKPVGATFTCIGAMMLMFFLISIKGCSLEVHTQPGQPIQAIL
ncbi:unnamed protein product [Meganyctiphanes norvegica]|uniref:Uncharacterized protein n=1 Tax=Meganyctiphanes norvegica TaxID=48144 RepID=A0AAV2Q764_MEGNR